MMKLAVRIPNWIGDAVLSVPFIKKLKELYHDTEIYLIGRYAPLQVFFNFPNITELIEIDDKKQGIIKTGFLLRKFRFDITYLLTDSLSSAIIGKISGSKKLYGYRKEGRSVFLSKSFAIPDNIHRSLKFLNLLSDSSVKDNLKAAVYLTDSEIASSRHLLRKYINNDKKIIGLNPNCSAESRKWPDTKFAALADKLIADYNVIFFGDASDIEYVDRVIKYMKNPNGIINLAGKINLREYMAILSKLHLFITNDSGPMHLANAVGTPVIALEGPADINETGVINKDIFISYITKGLECSPCVKNICPYGHNNCMKLITINDVLKEAERYFKISCGD